MLIYWKVRYLDRRDRTHRNRDLILVTTMLDAVTRAAVELLMETKTTRTEREILKFRHLFGDGDGRTLEQLMEGQDKGQVVSLTNYLEDEDGNELTNLEIGQVVTADPDEGVLLPFAPESHDLEYMRSVPSSLPFAEVVLSPEHLKILGYFTRDFRELAASTFMKEEHPATLRSGGRIPTGEYIVETSATDEEIRSFLTILRRLYMAKEPANFLKAVQVFSLAVGDHPKGKWVAGEGKSYQEKLDRTPDFRPFVRDGKCTFTRQRLIDVFLYTQYAHQPDDARSLPKYQREAQFEECLRQVDGKKSLLTWMFLTQVWLLAGELSCAGRIICGWFDHYCQHHNIAPDVLKSLLHEHPGIGAIEKSADKRARLLGEKTQELALELWKKNGSPPTGPVHFLHQAHEQLTKAINGPGHQVPRPNSG